MYYHVDYRRYKAVLKRLLSILLIFTVYFNSFSVAHAASLGGWTLGGSVVNGASVILNGSKELILNGASKIANGTAKITPTAAQVSKALVGGAAAVALDLAIKELLGSVDYVLDPANNSITFTDKSSGGSCLTTCTVKYYTDVGTGSTPRLACQALLDKSGMTKLGWYIKTISHTTCVAATNSGSAVTLSVVNGTAETSQDQKKSLPLSTVSNEIISMAEGGNATAQQAIKAAADTIVAEAETDSTKARPIVSQFEQTSTIETSETATSTSETTTANPEETATTETQTSFPVFCNWAPTLCQAANVVIQKPAEWAESIKTAYDDAVDYFKNDENLDQDNEPPEIKEIEPPTLNTSTFKGTAGCPAPIQVNVTIGSKGTTEISYEPICQFAEKWSFVAPLIGFLSGAMILIGVGRKGEDSEI